MQERHWTTLVHVQVPDQPDNAPPNTFFVDPAGSVYDITGYCRIHQFAPGSSGTNVKPIRTINIPKIACQGPYPLTDRLQLFADAKGVVIPGPGIGV